MEGAANCKIGCLSRTVCLYKGTFTVIYDAGRVDNLISLLSAGFGGITIFPLWPSTMEKGRDAKRVLVQARKGVKKSFPPCCWYGASSD